MARAKKQQEELPVLASCPCRNCGHKLINPRGNLWLHENPEHPDNPRLGWTFCGTNPAHRDLHAHKQRATP